MAHTHDVNARDAVANVGVDALEIVENGFPPVVPILFEEKLAILRGSAVDEGPIECPDGAVNVRAKTLVCGVHVAERGRVEENGVPRGFGTTRIGEAFEREIGSEPGGIGEIVEAGKTID